ncbi:MAG: S8 family serine peptidase [Methanobacteriota archaeon]|nr:MAG: S8 family serine peptidase [Euryarchaeota archaeon]
MVISSMIVAASAMASSESGCYGAQAEGLPPRDTSVPAARSWDWHALASEDGTVDVIVVLPEDESPAGVMSKAAQAKSDGGQGGMSCLRLTRSFSVSINGFAASLDAGDVPFLASLVPGSFIFPDLPVQATLDNSVMHIGADQAWSQYDPVGLPLTGEGMVVAVVDTGIDYSHPDLGGGFGQAYKVVGGYDFYNQDSDPMDDNGHGTHVAGIIAADGDGVKGVAPSANLLAYKVLGADGTGSMSLVVSAIDAALDPNGDGLTDDRADVISMSLGGSGSADDPVCLAVEEAVSLGVVVVIAAGNEGPSLGTVASPGLSPGAVTVGAVDDYGRVANFSSRGPASGLVMKPEITAPGVQIVSTVPYSGVKYCSSTGYLAMSGTSMATPHVSGAAALLLQMHPDWTPGMVKSALVSSSSDMGDSYWTGGAGEIWIPGGIDTILFSDTPLVSYGLAGEASVVVQLSNIGASASLVSHTDDWLSLTADGEQASPLQTGLSTVSPPVLSIASGGSASVSIDVSGDVSSVPEGYYDGEVVLSSGSLTHRIPFGFVVLSKLNVHVYDELGREVFDPYGGVFVYSLPDADVAMVKKGSVQPSPPASFLLPSGTYEVHALGHQLVYVYSNPYVLSTTVNLQPMETLEVDLHMSQAKAMTIDLQTEGGHPIFVKDFRMYVRHESARNVSFDLTGSDYSIIGSELFSIDDSMTVYVSDTMARVGVAASGFSYSPSMWSFMELNWDHWYEYVSGLSTAFMFEASADLQYLLAWEFDGVNAQSPSTLTWDDGTARHYITKYDIPGTIVNPWCDWGNHRSIGGDAAFFVRRDTDTSLNAFFSGMTRTTIVHGTFVELYYPRGLFEGFFERQYYEPDYGNLVHAGTVSEIYLPDRSFLTPLQAGTVVEVVGAGPFYPAVRTENTDDTLVLFHPLLRDQSGTRVGGKSGPSMSLYKNGALLGMYQLSEYLARPDAVRHVDLFGDGDYMASITYCPSSQVCDDVLIELGFAIPSTDIDPPQISWLKLPQRFVPGESLRLSFEAFDAASSVTASVNWRPSGSASWAPLAVTQESGLFEAYIPTSSSDSGVDVMIEVADESGNYLRYAAGHASLAQVPVLFEIAPQSALVPYRNSPVTVVLEGRLSDVDGNPLSSIAGVPLELVIAGEKVGMILDEYVSATTHVHDGSIRFEWAFDSLNLFSSMNETLEVLVEFDLGIYEPISRAFTITSVADEAFAPIITLNSPANGALFAPGETIDLSIEDDGAFEATVSLDGGGFDDLPAPWDIDTSGWSDGEHVIEVRATDDQGMVTRETYGFEVDGSPPEIEIIRPIDGAQVPVNFTIEASVSDDHLSQVAYSRDGGASVELVEPYNIDLTGWDIGVHDVLFVAEDVLGNLADASVQFEIVNSTIVLVVVGPSYGDVIRPGTPIDVDVYASGSVGCYWSDGGVQHELLAPYDIDTTYWAEGPHAIVIGASDDLGDVLEIDFEVVIDDTPPVVMLVTPALGSFVTPESYITVRATDIHLQTVSWSVFGVTTSSGSATNAISASFATAEGVFSVAVTAVDLAGNSALETFVFVMDLEEPELDISGVTPGDSITPGTLLTLSALDTYISYFAWSLDGEPFMKASAPVEYSTEGLESGWHQITLIAEDHAGRVAEKAVSFYIDDSPPSASLDEEYEATSGEPLVVRVVAVDDFGIGGGELRYESPNETFEAMAMTLHGAELVAAIEAEDLWDGMHIFVIVEDEAGNVFESPLATVSVLPASPAAPLPDAVDDGAEQTGARSSLLGTALMIGGAATAGLLVALLMSRRNRNAARRPSRRAWPRPYSASPARRSVPDAQRRAGRRKPAAYRSPATIAAPSTHRKGRRLTALEIHRMATDEIDREVVAQGIACAIEDQDDECDEVEKQLMSIISRGSVYGDDELSPDTVLDDDDPHRTPAFVSGLRLSRKMRQQSGRNNAS